MSTTKTDVMAAEALRRVEQLEREMKDLKKKIERLEKAVGTSAGKHS